MSGNKKNPVVKNKIVLGIPKGSLFDSTIDLFAKAGFNIDVAERSLYPTIDDPEIECLLMRAQEIPRYVEQGIIDVGITGKDWIEETDADVYEAAELLYSKGGFNPVYLVMAVPRGSKIKTVKDLQGKRVATELVNVTKKYLKEHNVSAEVEFSWGATESKAPRLVDAITELTDTGRSLQVNNLEIIDTVLESTTRVVVNHGAWADTWKKDKIETVVMLLRGALDAHGRVGLKMNIDEEKLTELITLLPALREPTISSLSELGWVSVEVILEERQVRELVPRLKKIGAEGIVEYPLNKIIY